jgi:hypothetical protein
MATQKKNENATPVVVKNEPTTSPVVEKKMNEMPMKQSILAAKELAAQVSTYSDGDDIEEHLRRLDDMSELMMVDETVKYQAILLSLGEPTRTEFNAWLKTENLRDEVKGKPEVLKKRLLEKFRVRKSMLERINFVLQPRRIGHRLVVDLLERKRVYDDVSVEMMKNREKLFVEAAMKLLRPEDRADYGNIRPDEDKRTIADLIEFVRRKEEEQLRDQMIESPQKKNDEDSKKTKKKRYDEEDEERERHLAQGRCFICHTVGHVAANCPEKKKKKNDDDDDVDDVSAKRSKGGKTAFGKLQARGSDASTF